MDKRMVLYRGSLKSCNYQCGYCPFSKHKASLGELETDKKQWFRFCESLLERAEGLDIHALLVTPYGEALIHPWYWEGLGRLAQSEVMEAVGAQTNLSFSLENALEIFEKAGGKREKLRLWGTFHPEMTEAEAFSKRCWAVKEAGILMCAGAVGVPENRLEIETLRKLLPEDMYLWINKMDGLQRPYTQEEISAFEAIDSYFERERIPVAADKNQCQGRLFVEGNGKIRGCNISSVLRKNWYGDWEGVFEKPPECGRKRCSCYLAYGGRRDLRNRELFGEYPLFRIPSNSSDGEKSGWHRSYRNQ